MSFLAFRSYEISWFDYLLFAALFEISCFLLHSFLVRCRPSLMCRFFAVMRFPSAICDF
jgi:hypothetical protein